MHTKQSYCLALLTILLLTGTPAWAHVSDHHTGLWAGLAHPFSGLDHLLAAFGIGMWAWARRIAADKRKVHMLTAACLAMILLSLLFAASLPATSLEWLLAGSVLVTGLLVLFAARLPFWSAALLAGFFVACHACAHVVEMPVAMFESVYSAVAYTGGFTAATLALFATGMIVARLLEKSDSRSVPMMGGALAACGLYLLNAV